MTWFVNLSDEGEFLGFYNNEINLQIPNTARPITDEQYHAWLAAGGPTYYWPNDSDVPIIKPVSDEERLAKAVDNKSREMKTACGNAIISGYVCDALGEPYLYPTTQIDTQNLGNSALDALSAKINNLPDWKTPFWCAKQSDDSWAFRDHTADQIIQVAQEVKSFVVGLQTHYADLLDQINSATSEAQVQALHW